MLQVDRGEKTGPVLPSPAAHPQDAATIIGPEHAADSGTEQASRLLSNEQMVFGVVVLQRDLVSREQLVAGFSTWVQNKSRTLAEILESQGALSHVDRQLGEQLTVEFIARNDPNSEQSLGALASLTTLRADLGQLNDADLSVSLSQVQIELSPELKSLNTPVPAPQATGSRSTGRFTILRPHADGGLGQVSVALDQELNREVALKQIQPRHADNPISRERFVVEAEITGGLEHPGIVPVYSLGKGADGRPFYAMRFVKGDSLKQAIDAYHDPANPERNDPGARQIGLRQLLSRFIAVCHALEYSHSRGVLHRDLKPANVMVGKYGETLVVDWGLAKAIDRPDVAVDETTLRPSSSASGSGHTLPGAVIGTPAYMSPEQAAGKLDQLGPPSDVYSLGATLYYLLCGQAPFVNDNLASILARVQRHDFPSPRSIATQIPAALEAICLKAMSLAPADRYQTARALADDLEHWLADEPVSALPEEWPQRVARWTRRHRAWAQAAVVALVAVTAVSIGAALLINQARHNEQLALLAAEKNAETARVHAEEARKNEELARINAQAALENAQTARQNEQRANQNAEAAQRSEKVALHARESAERNAQVVKDQFRGTVASVLELGGQLEKRLQQRPGSPVVPQMKSLHDELLKLLAENLLRLGKSVEATGFTDFALASTYDQTGELLLKLGRGAEALTEFEKGRQLVEESARQRPTDDVARANLALLTMKIGKTYLDVHDDARAALKNFAKSCELQRRIMTDPQGDKYKPADNQRLLSMYETQAGVAELRLGHPRQALEHFQAALELRQAWFNESSGNVMAYSYVSECRLWLGIVSWHLEDTAGMTANFDECLRICHELAEKYPKDASFLGDLADVYGSYGDAQLRLGLRDEAGKSYEKSHNFFRSLMQRKGDDVSSLPLLAQIHEREALVAAQDQDAVKSAEHYELARKARDQLAELDAANLSWLAARALTLAGCGRSAEAAEQAALLLQRAPDSSAAQLQAARCLAVCAQGASDPDQKRQYIERALSAVAAAVKDDFEDPVLLTTDPYLAVLKPEPAFQALLEKAQRK